MKPNLFTINLHPAGYYEMVFESEHGLLTVEASVNFTHQMGRKILETVHRDFPPGEGMK